MTRSSDFPITDGAFNTSYNDHNILYDVCVVKINQFGSGLDYSTYLGAYSDDIGNGICVDNFGNAYITGHTNSTSFPTTEGSFSPNWPQYGSNMNHNIFITKLDQFGSSLIYSTYIGSNTGDYATAIDIDDFGNAYIRILGNSWFSLTLSNHRRNRLWWLACDVCYKN